VNGRGIEILRNAGIKVTESDSEIEREAKNLNRGFIFAQKYHRPFITLKAAISLDGRLCLPNGSSKWITGILSRTYAHRLRAENDAVLVGVNTVLNDDPELTVRNVTGINPIRIVLDRHNRTPLNAKVRDCMILNHEDLHEAMKYLSEQGILTLMVEGGAEVLSSFLREGLADYVNFFYSPKILGDGKGINMNIGIQSVKDSLSIKNVKYTQLGEDIMIEGRLSCSPDL
jgi:diaminohydroxyphosphoribosylaminopyrimidine deaminase/5-amino-6-(5-phosphoribosylamino)uracil reductase